MVLVVTAEAGFREDWWLCHGKRVFDALGAAVLLALFLPLIATLWALVRRDGGPGFHGHPRVGRHGRLFRCWKLRSMVPDPATRLAMHLAANQAAAEEWRGISSGPTIPASPGWGTCCTGPASTSCRSCGTSCAAR